MRYTNASLAAAGASALAGIPTEIIGVSTQEKRDAARASRDARDVAAHAAWAAIIRKVFDAAASEPYAKVCITEWAGILKFDPEGEDYGHYREMPTAAELDAFIKNTPESKAFPLLRDFAECADSYEAQRFDAFLTKAKA